MIGQENCFCDKLSFYFRSGHRILLYQFHSGTCQYVLALLLSLWTWQTPQVDFLNDVSSKLLIILMRQQTTEQFSRFCRNRQMEWELNKAGKYGFAQSISLNNNKIL